MTRERWILGGIIGLFFCSICLSLIQIKGFSLSGDYSPNRDEAIGIIYVYGPITVSEPSALLNARSNNVDDIIQTLNQFEENDSIKALILRVNSPGGTVGASQELFNELLAFKKRTKIPVITSFADIGTSGAYWISLASDHIFSNPGSLVGNIGVKLENINFSKLAEKYGIDLMIYKSGLHKDILSSWRTTTTSEKEILNTLVSTIHAQFVTSLKTHRKLSQKEALRLSDGQFYSGEQALKLGLVDQLGGLSEAIAYAIRVTNIQEKPELIRRPRPHVNKLLSILRNNLSFESIMPFNLSTPVLN